MKVGDKIKISFPNKIKASQSIKVVSKLLGVSFGSASTTYYRTASASSSSPQTIQKALQANGSLGWFKDKVLYFGGGYGPDADYLTSDSSGNCGVWVYQSASEWRSDYSAGIFPWNYDPYWSFIDKKTGFGIFASTSSKSSTCAKAIMKTFSLK